VAGLTVLESGNHYPFCATRIALAMGRGNGGQSHELTVEHCEVIYAAWSGNIGAEEGATVVQDIWLPLQLVECLQVHSVASTLRSEDHLHWHQPFLEFSARTTQGSDIPRVHRVNTSADKGTFTPADHLLANAQVPWPVA